MLIYAATIHSGDDPQLILANSAFGRMNKIANYCRQSWADAMGNESIPLTDAAIVEKYFDEEAMGPHEYVIMYDKEEVI